MKLWSGLDYPTFDMNIINKEKKAARHKFIQSFVSSLKVEPEFPVEKPAIFGYVDAEEHEPVDFWINKSSMDNSHLIMPKSWDLMIRADRVNWRQHTLTVSLAPENIIKENKSIPLFVFEYFWQNDITGF